MTLHTHHHHPQKLNVRWTYNPRKGKVKTRSAQGKAVLPNGLIFSDFGPESDFLSKMVRNWSGLTLKVKIER